MLTKFDWLRRSRTGSELLTTLKYFAAKPNYHSAEDELGAPFSALHGPCERCHIYSRVRLGEELERYCKFCKLILTKAHGFAKISKHGVVIWGLVQELPKQFRHGEGVLHRSVLGSYVHDDSRFLLMLRKRDLKAWLQELVLYHGADLLGLLQIIPSLGHRPNTTLGELLNWAMMRESSLPMDRLRVQFYARAAHVFRPRQREREGALTFEVSEFLNLLEMAEVFRANLYPEEQQQLYDLLTLEDFKEEQFYWGRFVGGLSQEAKDMLALWRIRQWPTPRVQLLFELTNYVNLPDLG
jgi:hypothetical protein